MNGELAEQSVKGIVFNAIEKVVKENKKSNSNIPKMSSWNKLTHDLMIKKPQFESILEDVQSQLKEFDSNLDENLVKQEFELLSILNGSCSELIVTVNDLCDTSYVIYSKYKPKTYLEYIIKNAIDLLTKLTLSIEKEDRECKLLELLKVPQSEFKTPRHKKINEIFCILNSLTDIQKSSFNVNMNLTEVGNTLREEFVK